MKITKNQIEQLDRAAHEEFHQRALVFLRENVPIQFLGDDDAASLGKIANAHQVALSYGIKTERGVLQFFALVFVAGEDFHKKPAVHRYLSSPELNGDQKMKLLMNTLQPSGSGRE